jgi:uncharacterized membrane protein YvbJ
MYINLNKMMARSYFVLVGLFLSSQLSASDLPEHDLSARDFITEEPDGSSYQFVSSYDISIKAAPEKVWKNLENLKSWMYKFEMSHRAGTPGEIGQVL